MQPHWAEVATHHPIVYAGSPLIRVLHILDAGVDFQTQRAADELSRGLAQDFKIDRHDLRSGDDVHNLLGMLARRNRKANYDLIHAFGSQALLAGSLTGNRPVIYTPPAELRKSDDRRLRLVARYRNVLVVCSNRSMQDRIVRQRFDSTHCRLVSPGIDLSRLPVQRNDALRRELGLSDKDFVLLAPGESTLSSNHQLALWTCAILSELDPQYKLLLWSRGCQARSLRAGRNSWRRSDMVVFAEEALNKCVEFEELLSVADAILITATEGAAVLPIGLSMASGLPIVSVTNSTTTALLEGNQNTLMTSSNRPRELAQCVLDVRAGNELSQSTAKAGRILCGELFSLSRYQSDFSELYRSMAVSATI